MAADYRSIVAALELRDGSDGDSVDAFTHAVGAVSLPVLPASHFTQDDPPPGTPLQVSDDGRVWGIVAPSATCHRGMPGCVTIESLEAAGPIDWQGGQLSSPIRLDDGSTIRTLPLTMRGGHPDTNLTAAQARAHHDDTATVVADVVAWRSPTGVAVSGTLRPDLDADDLREMLGAAPSIEIWPTESGRVLLGIQLVNTPAWPVPTAAAVDTDSGLVILESGGVLREAPCDCDEPPTLDELAARVRTVEQIVATQLAAVPVFATLESTEV